MDKLSDPNLTPLPNPGMKYVARSPCCDDALTMVDDAHGEGVLGKGGRGIVNHFGLEGEVDITVG